ncbi:hypothetical protein [Bradyrhizobium canariense]|uniref:hypothetical protein n=1 Tax=Bradyrhizobium canariense TaxID=255045 RepID=UPI0018D314E6|nr:hypothetical protein [Bradyrhizobium canariense]
MTEERLANTNYQFAPDEAPTFPGSPFAPRHNPWRRVGYAATGTLVGIATSFPNALTSVNVGTISGSLGLYVAQASWLPAIFYAMNASGNLTLVKARIQFGIPAVTYAILICYSAVAVAQIAIPSFGMAVLVRAVNGLMGAALVSLSVYYFLQVFPAKVRPLALLFGVSLPQLGSPLARLVPVELLAVDHWQGLHLIELAVGLCVLTSISLFPLPPSQRSRAFERLDFLTIACVVSAMLLSCAVLGLGRVLWWTDTPWLGWMLIAAVPLFMLAAAIETTRQNPLVHFEWLGTIGMLRFAAIALLVRLALAEQTFGSVGLLFSGGLNNDQLHTLFWIVILAMALGLVTAALTLSEQRIPYQVIAAAVLIAIGALMDSQATSLTRPPQLYLSQALIGFGTTLFVGPALLFGFLQLIRKGPDHLITLVVLFSITQNVGALAGSAVVGSYQVIQIHAHAAALSEDLLASNPQVLDRLQSGARALSPVIVDPSLGGAEGASLLGNSLMQQASILAFNDVFRLLALLAFGTALYVGWLVVLRSIRGGSNVKRIAA